MNMKTGIRVVHALAGVVAFLTICQFLASTIAAELFGNAAAIAGVKADIVSGLFVLVPALALAGATGFAMTGPSPKGLPARKLGRMKIVAANGLLVLIPAALFLDWKAGAGELDAAFFAVQAFEIIAGAVNLALLGLNVRDGLRMSGRFRRAKA